MMFRLEPLTTLIVGLIMVFANLLVVEQAVSDTITGDVSWPIFLNFCKFLIFVR
ncbi:unnamed protein product [Nippostrongylus brasiliensis]|uniref:Secreted protein n=1 Tax=Nippostrongylus brasiliensis TaxID=27835 RepID=A0A0N4XQK2_NIPBR|nr:unnamed protein product [Nippostrongylus brasiliensis]